MNTLITALATPYVNGEIDTYSYEKLVAFQLENGVDALLAVGTTAESQLLDLCEKKLLVKITKRMAGNTPVFVGVDGRGTYEATLNATVAEEWGADGLLVAPPSFVKCTPEGYLKHVEAISQAVNIPLMLYNAPSRCNYILDKDVVKQLAKVATYLKDAGSDLDYTADLAKHLKVLCGNDFLLPHMLNSGAVGVVSVVSNLAPNLTREVLNRNEQFPCQQCDKNTKQDGSDDEKVTLFKTLAQMSMLEVSPIAIKYMLYKKGIFNSYEMRLPLTSAKENTRIRIDKMWEENNDLLN